jgi:hypothetical protein
MLTPLLFSPKHLTGKGGKNRRRGKNDNDDKRELIFKEDGQGKNDDQFDHN